MNGQVNGTISGKSGGKRFANHAGRLRWRSWMLRAVRENAEHGGHAPVDSVPNRPESCTMIFGRAKFADRAEAGRLLADALKEYAAADPLVMALPRGGVPVAFEVARALGAQLDVVLVRKLGAPGRPEYGIGAVVDGADPQVVLNEEAMAYVKPPPEYVEAEKTRQLAEIERRRELYGEGRAPHSVAGRTVIVVDDGIATGGTMRAALQALRKAGAARVVLAVPVAPGDTLDDLAPLADAVVCLASPKWFQAVGLHYSDFRQTSDDEVIRLLGEADRLSRGSTT
jgi:putative phosphoribosyl transferase